MRKEIGIESWCPECGHGERIPKNYLGYLCPKCGAHVHNSYYITCECGTTVYLDSNTNECEGCGQLWNGFGQSLKPRNEWEEDY